MAAKYIMADILGITLMESMKEEDGLWGAGNKEISLGPWKLNVWMEVNPGPLSKKSAITWVKFTSRLWARIEATTKKSIIQFFDSSEVSLTLAEMKNGAELESSVVRGTFRYSDPDSAWKKA